MSELRILLVDDHEVVRTGLRSLVDACPDMTVVGETGNGAEAIARSRALRPDVVVMDRSMPEIDGVAATEEIRRENADVKVVVLTAREDATHLPRLLQAGATGYVLKHGAADELIRAIRSVAAGSSYVYPTVAGALLKKATRSFGGDTHPLSEREEEVLRRVAWGEGNKEIAENLGISTKTVETYKARIAEKLGLQSRTDMVRFALKRGWLSEE